MKTPNSKRSALTQLAEKMVQTLESLRNQAGQRWPTLTQLALATDPQALSADVEKASGTKAFKAQVVPAQKKNLAAPVALRADLDAFAASSVLLEFVLDSVCSAEAPTYPVSRLKSKVNTPLKKPFEAALLRQIEAQSLPPTIEHIQIKKTRYLHPLRLPLPPPPKEPALELAEQMIAILEESRRRSDGAYPLALERLIGMVMPPPSAAVAKKAQKTPLFQQRMVLAAKKKPDAPVILVEDCGLQAGSRPVLEFVLRASRQMTAEAFAVTALAKKILPQLRPDFVEAVKQQLNGGSLPSTVGWIWSGKKQLIFLLSDLHGGTPRVSPGDAAALALPADLVAAIEAAFDRLNRQAGSHNFVNLVDLRKALPVARESLDGELRRLRLVGRYSLSAAEGRHGLRPEEQDAGILEDGTLLLYLSRKTP
jgi:hypothetical protein